MGQGFFFSSIISYVSYVLFVTLYALLKYIGCVFQVESKGYLKKLISRNEYLFTLLTFATCEDNFDDFSLPFYRENNKRSTVFTGPFLGN